MLPRTRRAVLVAVAAAIALPASAQGAAAPTFAPVIAEPAQRLTTCSLPCAGNDLVTDAGDDVVILIRPKPRTAEVSVARALLVLQGDHDPTVEELAGTSDGSGDPRQVTIAVGDRLAPDHYDGALLLTPSSSADQVVIPFSLDVRYGPLLPLLLLVFGLFFGWLIERIFKLAPKREFSTAAERLRQRINALPASEKALLTPLFDATRELRGQDLATATRQLDSLEAAVRALRQSRDLQDAALSDPFRMTLVAWVQRLEGTVGALGDAIRSYAAGFDREVAAVQRAAEELMQAHAAGLQLTDLSSRAEQAAQKDAAYDAFTQTVEAARRAIADVSPDPGDAAPALPPLLAEVRRRYDLLQPAQAAAAPGTPLPAGVGGVLGTASAALPATVLLTSPGATFDTLADIAKTAIPIASGIVVLVVLAIGFKLTYLDDATFGASISDWSALFVWGLAAWGTRQALTGLGPPAAKA
ncbi:hypothetical protein VSS74_05400 [Conexibacter stalactiti]|uniref:Uncharacterized protein n=1 Tax=Conexibacter stalactiti TaxID=1940611 RepID=A0ABU4HKC2_9ACTN|nr:hypothetical protein [Conexibacter stalactiti]MDW5593758.1 hypothetical protein [Conexibacter stalactiti]MEC5034400.1 hypothetical protein [Conexibacter stalactiti]